MTVTVAALVFLVLGAALVMGMGVLAVAAYSAHTVVRPRRLAPRDDRRAPPVPVESVTFRNRHGHRLAGWFLPPALGQPLAIVCHGYAASRRDTHHLLPWLRERGYGALVFDFQGHGDSEGHVTTVGWREVDDALAAVDYAQQRLGSGAPLVMIGFSMGAAVAIMAAARCPAVRAVIADSPFASLERAIARNFRRLFRLPPGLFARPTIWFCERFTGAQVRHVVPVAAIAAIAPRPLLLIHGTLDEIVDPADGHLLYAAAGEPKALWRVEGCGHLQGWLLHPEEYVRRLGEFLDHVFGAASAAA